MTPLAEPNARPRRPRGRPKRADSPVVSWDEIDRLLIFGGAYIAGTEVFVGILNGRVLSSVEVRPATRFYDYEAKYKRIDTRYLIPPELPAPVIERAHALALTAYTALECSGHARPDLRITPSGNAFVLEVNTLPGMIGTSLLPRIAKNMGMDYATLCEGILASTSTI